MNKRSKTLLAIAGGIVAILVLKAGVGLYRDTLRDRDDQIKGVRAKLADAQFQRLEAEYARKKWMEIGAQTLSMDVNEAERRLRDDLFEITRKSGLQKEKVDLGTLQPSGKNGVRVLTNSTVSGEGTIDQIVQLLYTLHRRPYLVRVKDLTLQQASTGKNAVKGQMKLTAKLETLILPANAKVPAITPVDFKKDKDKQVPRTQFPDLKDYMVINDRRIVSPYVPPMPGKASNPSPPNDAKEVDFATVTLTWTAGAETKQHQIFFNANAPPGPQLAASQTTTQFPRPGLQSGTRYFWRIDEVGEGGTTQGDVWSFTTKSQIIADSGTKPPPPPPPPPPPIPPPPPDGNMMLVRVLSSATRQQAILVDPAQQNNPQSVEKRVEVGEQLFGGTLIYIHPKGAVSERDGTRRFHALGVPLQQAQNLTEENQPEIWLELRKLEVQATGISERPG